MALTLAVTLFSLRSSGTVNAAQIDSSKSWISRGLPNPALTPGDRGTQPIVSFQIGDDTRKEVFAAYGLVPMDSKYALCLLIPASLGGTIEAKNLFPATLWFADLKSRLDKQLVEEVAAGRISADEAAAELKTDWIRAMHRHKVRNYGMHDKQSAAKVEQALHW
jgi:hypothetical protein